MAAANYGETHISGRWLLVAVKGLLQEIVKNPVMESFISCWGG